MHSSVLFAGAVALFVVGFFVGHQISPLGAVGLGLMWIGLAIK